MRNIDFSALTDTEREDFTRGFDDADDIGVDDWEMDTPWGCPWFWADSMESDSSEVWGREWFRQNRADILEFKSRECDELAADDLPELMQKMGSEATEADARRFAAWCAGHGVNPLTCSENAFYSQLNGCFSADAA